MNYKMFVVGNLYSEFEAKNDQEAKKKVHKLCLENEYLFEIPTGVSLVGEEHCYKYKPMFNEWSEM